MERQVCPIDAILEWERNNPVENVLFLVMGSEDILLVDEIPEEHNPVVLRGAGSFKQTALLFT